MGVNNECHILEKTACKHCHEQVITPFLDESGEQFCCQGCRSVYHILNQNGLENFYKIQEQTGDYTLPVKKIEDKQFSYLNNPDFIKKYAQTQRANVSMTFYLEGVHCLACLWLIEKLPEMVTNVKSARLDMSKNLVDIELIDGDINFSQAAQVLNSLGYKPFPISNTSEEKERRKKEDHSLLLRIGVAAAAMMNIMLYSGSIYLGADGIYLKYFGLISFALCLPVVLYSATPFYKSAWGAIKNKHVNIDVPLALAIIFSFIVSTYFAFTGSSHHYFDSLATLTFLILSSRYLLRKAQQSGFEKKDLSSFFLQGTIRKRTQDQSIIEIHPEQIEMEDHLVVLPGETLPADGKIIRGETRLNLATLTGESIPVLQKVGSYAYMGSQNVGNEFTLEVVATGAQTRLGKILGEVERQSQKRSQYTLLTDTVSKYFVLIVLSLTALSFIGNYYLHDLETALTRSLSLIIVTCPCALGLATPLVFSRILSLCAKMGIIVKSEYSLETIAKTKNIFFDKTGTLTSGEFDVEDVKIISPPSINFSIEDIIFSLESNSHHPLANSLVRWASSQSGQLKRVPWSLYEEMTGKGIRAIYNEKEYEIFTISGQEDETMVLLTEDAKPVTQIRLKDRPRPESRAVLRTLRKNKLNLFLSSGDKRPIVEHIGKSLGFDKEHLKAELSPEAKATWMEHFDNTIFVGDGANDALAFSKASASVAMQGAVEVSLKTSDAFLYRNDLNLIETLINNAKQSIRLIKQNLVFSLIYNIIGAYLALTGFIGPLEAAILMPISSFTVLANTLYGTRLKKGAS